jgi:hypothetical protein
MHDPILTLQNPQYHAHTLFTLYLAWHPRPCTNSLKAPLRTALNILAQFSQNGHCLKARSTDTNQNT